MNTSFPISFKTREKYLLDLAQDFGLSYATVLTIADEMGDNENHDALVTLLEDYVDSIEDMYDEWEWDDE